jgi:surface antigen
MTKKLSLIIAGAFLMALAGCSVDPSDEAADSASAGASDSKAAVEVQDGQGAVKGGKHDRQLAPKKDTVDEERAKLAAAKAKRGPPYPVNKSYQPLKDDGTDNVDAPLSLDQE